MDTGGLGIAHDSPGRLRLRVPRGARVEGLPGHVAGLEGVIGCDWSPHTRSLLIRYDPAAQSPGALVEAVADHGGVTASPPRAERMLGPPRDQVAADAVTGTVAALDGQVRRVTRGAFGLRTLLPLGLAAWAVSEVVRGRARPLAWTSALWYAHGLLRDYTGPAHVRSDVER